MNDTAQTAKTYVISHRKAFIIGAGVLVVLAALVATVILLIYNSMPKVVYQPANACDMLTPTKAKKLLGDKSIISNIEQPTISDNTAASSCGYTDGNPDMNSMIVAAITVRSGVNDAGVQQNKSEFVAGRPANYTETVKNVGDSAYFNKKLGQLNVLKGRDWIILSYGVGSAPQGNTLKDATKLAKTVLD